MHSKLENERLVRENVGVWLHELKYLLTSYVSTNAINPSGNAIANDTMAANSPSLDSSGDTSSNRANR